MKEDIPDYTQYSLADLRDVQARINREKYPDTYAALQNEMKKRGSEQPVEESFLWESPFLALPSAALGVYCGYWGLDIMRGHIWPAPGARNDLAPWLGVLVGGGWLFVALLCLIPSAIFLRIRRKS